MWMWQRVRDLASIPCRRRQISPACERTRLAPLPGLLLLPWPSTRSFQCAVLQPLKLGCTGEGRGLPLVQTAAFGLAAVTFSRTLRSPGASTTQTRQSIGVLDPSGATLAAQPHSTFSPGLGGIVLGALPCNPELPRSVPVNLYPPARGCSQSAATIVSDEPGAPANMGTAGRHQSNRSSPSLEVPMPRQ